MDMSATSGWTWICREFRSREWEVHADGKVKPFIQLTWPEALEENSSSYPENEPHHVEWLLKSGWREVNSPFSEPR